MTIKEKIDEFNELSKYARNVLIDSIVRHFDGDNWTIEELEDLWDAQIYDNTSMSSEEEMAYTDAETSRSNGFISLSKATDRKEIRNLLETDLEYDFGTLLLYANNQYHTDLSRLVIPYTIVVLDSKKAKIRDWDNAEKLLDDTDTVAPSDIKDYIVCKGKKDLLEKWEENLKKYEGEWYSVSDPSTTIVGGVYDPNDKEYLEELYDEEKTDYLTMAKNFINNADKGFVSTGRLISSDPKVGEALLVAKKDPSLEDVYEIWVKVGYDRNGNGGKIIGKIYDLCGVEEFAQALKEIDNEEAILTVQGERKNIADVLKGYKQETEKSVIKR